MGFAQKVALHSPSSSVWRAASDKSGSFDFEAGALETALGGVDVLASAYGTHHKHRPVGHRGPWLSHAEAVERSWELVEAVRQAGILPYWLAVPAWSRVMRVVVYHCR